MALRNTPDRFGAVSKLLHWATLVAVATTVPLAWIMQEMPLGVAKFEAYGWHKSIGILILTLTLVRLAWRWSNPRPRPLAGPVWQRRLAAAVHAGLYACLIAMPTVGLLHSAAANTPVSVFGLFVLPPPIGPDRALVEPLATAHGALALALLGLIALHVAGALKHHLLDRDATLRRMLPFTSAGDRS